MIKKKTKQNSPTNQKKKQTKEKKNTPNNLPVKRWCSLHLDTCVHFLNFYLLVSFTFAVSDPNGAEWCALSIWENAGVELLDCLLVWFALHAAGYEECVQRFSPPPFRNKQFHLFVVSISILYSPWVLMLFSEMWRPLFWKLPVQSRRGRDHSLVNWEVSPLTFSKSTLSWLVIFSDQSEANSLNISFCSASMLCSSLWNYGFSLSPLIS